MYKFSEKELNVLLVSLRRFGIDADKLKRPRRFYNISIDALMDKVSALIAESYHVSIPLTGTVSLEQAMNRQTRETLRAELNKVKQPEDLPPPVHKPGQPPRPGATPQSQFEELRRAWCDDFDWLFNRMTQYLNMPEQESRQHFDGDSISTDIYIAKQTKSVLDEIERQNDKWGITDHYHDKWLMLISKQLGQAYQAVIDNNIDGAPQHLIDHQLRQIAALCIQALMNSQRDGKDK